MITTIMLSYIFIIDIHATGNVKLVSFTSGTLFVLIPFVSYLFLKLGFDVDVVFIIMIVTNAFLSLMNILLVKFYAKIDVLPFFIAFSQVVIASSSTLIIMLNQPLFEMHSLIRNILNIVIAILLVIMSYCLICFNRSQLRIVIGFLKSKLTGHV